MPTLLQINATANWGSTGKIAELIGREAMARGWQSYIAYGRYHSASASQLIRVGGKIDTYFHFAGQRLFDDEGLCSSRATRRLINRIAEIEPDIIHLHNIHDHFLNYRLLFEYLNRTDIEVVWTMHDFWPVTGHCMHFVNAGCDLYRTGCHDCPMRGLYPKTLFDRSDRNYELKKNLFTANRNLTIVCVSQWVCDMLKTSFLKEFPIHVINNGVDISHFRPTPSSAVTDFLGDKFIIMSVASQWKFDKGLEDYIMMAGMLSEDEAIVLVGVDDGIAAALPKNIIGIEPTTDTGDLAELYTRADVVTVLSSAETFGLTVAEAYACGTPAVVYDNTAPPELIAPETGLVVENHNYRAAYEAIREIKALGKEHYSAACIRSARTRYDKDICSANYLALYEQLLG